jgi:hypothetical protein
LWPFRLTPQKAQEQKLLRQWRADKLQVRLQEFPLRLLLWKLQRDTEACPEANPGWTVSSLARLKRCLRIGKKTASEKQPLAPLPTNSSPSRPRSLPPFLVQLQRRLVVRLLCLVVDLILHLFRGKRTR